MQTTDLFSVLEIGPDAGTEDVRRAYFRLAKKLHPDRQAGDDPEATERFLAVQNAYEILVDPARRAEYAAGLGKDADEGASAKQAGAQEREAAPAPKRSRGPSLEEERDARTAFHKAEQLMESDQHDRALRAMLAVVKVVPENPDYLSLLGYLMAHEGEKLHAARDYCRRAIEAEPFNPEFQYRLGYVYAQAGLTNTAQQYFEEALRLHPKHEGALLLRDRGAGGAGGGLLGSLKRLLGR